jgi:hypothetical protein
MRQGLIAQWHRGIAARGLVGAMLLMIPVLVGATIGLGGVGSGLTSLATGPSETAVGGTPKVAGTDGSSKSIERLSASLTTTLAQRTIALRRPGKASGSQSTAAPLASSVSGGTQTDSGSSTTSSSGSNTPAATGSGSGASTPPATSPAPTAPLSQPTDAITQLLQGLLGQK